MSDIGLIPAGASALFPALLILVVGAPLTLGATLRAWLRSRRQASALLDDPAAPFAVAGGAACLLALALAVTASEATLETREALDAWWLTCVAVVLGGAGLAGWSARRLRRS